MGNERETLVEARGLERPDTIGDVLDLDGKLIASNIVWDQVFNEDPIFSELELIDHVFSLNDYEGELIFDAKYYSFLLGEKSDYPEEFVFELNDSSDDLVDNFEEGVFKNMTDEKIVYTVSELEYAEFVLGADLAVGQFNQVDLGLDNLELWLRRHILGQVTSGDRIDNWRADY